MIFVSLFIGTMLLFMLGTVIYVTSQVANCSSAKKHAIPVTVMKS